VVYDADDFQANRKDGQSHLFHEWQMGQPRGEPIGAYAVVRLKNGEWRYELMDLEELEKIRNRAPAKNGPWATDTNEMRRKTIVRRTLKMYADDPAVQRILEITDEDTDPESEVTYEPRQKVRPSKLNQQVPGLDPGEAMTPDGQIVDAPDPLSRVRKEFDACTTTKACDALYDSFMHPDAGFTEEQRSQIAIIKDACLSILNTKTKSKQTSLPGA